MRQQKPARLDKVLAWRQTYHEVLDELHAGGLSATASDMLKAAAARTAAILIQGVEYEKSRE